MKNFSSFQSPFCFSQRILKALGILIFFFSFGMTEGIFAQTRTRIVPDAEEKKIMAAMKKDGLSDAAINKWLYERKLIYPNGTHTGPLSKMNKTTGVNATGLCSDMGAEGGWSVWEAATGDYTTGVTTWNATGLVPTAPRFNITSGAGTDPCAPGPQPNAPPLTLVAPAFGNSSIQIGQPGFNGSMGGCSAGCVERLIFNLQVTPSDTNFIYAYAVVLENPITPIHTAKQVPYAEILMLDQNGDTVTCSYHKYMGDTTGAGTQTGMWDAACTGPAGQDVSYQPWTIFGINLVAYIGQTVKVIITNSDCALGGHECYSYWDFLCPPVSGTSVPFCVGQQTTIIGPPSIPGVTFTYTWYQNHQVYTGPPSASSQSITPTPAIGDTFSIYVQEPSGCNFWMPFAPAPTTIVPNFHFKGTCGVYTFMDSSNVSPVSTTNAVTNWQWSFPGGTPATASTATVTPVKFPPGTYTVTLIVTSTAGCKDTIKHVLTVGGFPTAAFTPSSPCLGSATTLLDGSLAVTGDPIASWNWAMPGGTPTTATSQNTATTYGTAGTHTVSLVVTSVQGCIDTIVQQVLVYNPPIANFSKPDSGCAPICVSYNDLSTSTDGTINSWQWSFPGGAPGSSTSQAPKNICYTTPGKYGVSLIVTTNYGCKDTIALPMIEVFPWPKADFCVAPSVQPTTDPVFSFCDMWSPDVVAWSWNFGDNDSDKVNTDPVHSYSATANQNDFYAYQICIRVQNVHGCWDTTCKLIEIIPEFEFYIPNTFTPNGDWTNEMFYGKSRGVKDYNIWLFDRWGNQIWDCHKTDKNTNWDSDATVPKQEGLASACQWNGVVVEGGMDMNGKSRQLAQEDVYVWKVKLTDIFNKKHTYIGHVNIVR